MKEALNKGQTRFSVCKRNHVEICRNIFKNAEQYCFGCGENWHSVNITERGIKKLERELKKNRMKYGG